jgi:hypothetical protein
MLLPICDRFMNTNGYSSSVSTMCYRQLAEDSHDRPQRDPTRFQRLFQHPTPRPMDGMGRDGPSANTTRREDRVATIAITLAQHACLIGCTNSRKWNPLSRRTPPAAAGHPHPPVIGSFVRSRDNRPKQSIVHHHVSARSRAQISDPSAWRAPKGPDVPWQRGDPMTTGESIPLESSDPVAPSQIQRTSRLPKHRGSSRLAPSRGPTRTRQTINH